MKPPPIPDLFASNERCMEAYRHMLAHPHEIDIHLLLAAGFLMGSGKFGAAASCILARAAFAALPSPLSDEVPS